MFLKKLDLKSTLSQTDAELCATHLTNRISQANKDFETVKELLSCSELLVKEIVSYKYNSEKLQCIFVFVSCFLLFFDFSALRYIPVDQEATELPNYCGSDQLFTAFCDSVHSKDVHLVWLHTPAVNYLTPMSKPITIEMVIENMLTFVYKVAKPNWQQDSLNTKLPCVMHKIYSYLNREIPKKSTSSSLSSWNKLNQAKWILVEYQNEPTFASPSQAYLEHHSYPGFLYKIPELFDNSREYDLNLFYLKLFSCTDPFFFSLFKCVNIGKFPTIPAICDALKTRSESEAGTLNPNEFKESINLLTYLALIIQKTGSYINLHAIVLDHEIYVPNNERMLKPLSQVIKVDIDADYLDLHSKFQKILDSNILLIFFPLNRSGYGFYGTRS